MEGKFDIDDLIRMIDERERKHQELDMAGEPQVGIFWLINKKLIIYGTCWSIAEQVDVFRSSPIGHDEFWRTVPFGDTKLKEYPYDYFPRGRVTYDTQKDVFHLYLDRCILRKKTVVAKIITQMRLPAGKTHIETDTHYQCSRCNPEYLSFKEKGK
jgi:hypothetical protein